jgi:hypothetical protein
LNDGSARSSCVAGVRTKLNGGLYEISSDNSGPGSFDWNGDSSNTAETIVLQRQRMLQDGLL